MSELFNDQSCVHWWLPNDEGFTPMLQTIRAFADDRNAAAASTQGENLRQIRHVFSKMDIGPRGGSIGKTAESSGDGGPRHVKEEGSTA